MLLTQLVVSTRPPIQQLPLLCTTAKVGMGPGPRQCQAHHLTRSVTPLRRIWMKTWPRQKSSQKFLKRKEQIINVCLKKTLINKIAQQCRLQSRWSSNSNRVAPLTNARMLLTASHRAITAYQSLPIIWVYELCNSLSTNPPRNFWSSKW